MADYDSSLPVRTQNPGDVIAKIADATTPSQQLSVDASGHIFTNIFASAGSTLTATGTSLDVNITGGSSSSGVPDRTAFTYGTTDETPVGGVFNDTGATLTSGTTGALRLTALRGLHTNLRDAAGVETGTAANPLRIDPTGTTPQPVSGTVTVTQATASNLNAQVVGNVASGAADSGNPVKVGGVFNTVAPTLTNGQRGDLQLDSSANLKVVLSGTSTVTVSNFPATVDTNYGTVGASTIRTAAQIGNATGAANFNAGATGAQTLRVEANQGASATAANGWFVKPTDGTNSQSYTAAGSAKIDLEQVLGATHSATNPVFAELTNGTAVISPTNPLPVYLQDGGTPVNSYNTSSALAAGASSNHDYTVTAAKTLQLQQIHGSASGKLKVEVQIETGVATGVFTTVMVGFNSTATPNIDLVFPAYPSVAAGVRVRVIRTNRDLLADDVYSTITGHEN